MIFFFSLLIFPVIVITVFFSTPLKALSRSLTLSLKLLVPLVLSNGLLIYAIELDVLRVQEDALALGH